MSSLTIPTASATLAPMNVHPHGHGHKKGSPLDPTDDSSSTAGQFPVGSAQNLFGSLFNSLQQLIGAQPVAASAAANGAAAGSQAAKAAAAGSKINIMA